MHHTYRFLYLVNLLRLHLRSDDEAIFGLAVRIHIVLWCFICIDMSNVAIIIWDAVTGALQKIVSIAGSVWVDTEYISELKKGGLNNGGMTKRAYKHLSVKKSLISCQRFPN
jgi:hypothetical protein